MEVIAGRRIHVVMLEEVYVGDPQWLIILLMCERVDWWRYWEEEDLGDVGRPEIMAMQRVF
jgi:hypothetical protein